MWRNIRRKTWAIILTVVLLCSASGLIGYQYAKAQTSSLSALTLSAGPLPGAASETIFSDGNGNYYAKDNVGAINVGPLTSATTVFSTAISDVPLGGELYITNGVYPAQITITNENITIIGESPASTSVQQITVANTNVWNKGITIENLEINGVNNANNGLSITNTFYSYFTNIYIVNCADGIYVESSLGDYFVGDKSTLNNYGIVLNSVPSDSIAVNAIIFSGCDIEANIDGGVLIQGYSNLNQLQSCVIEGNLDYEVCLHTVHYSSSDYQPAANMIEGCWFELGSVLTSGPVILFTSDDSLNYAIGTVIENNLFEPYTSSYAISNILGSYTQFIGNMIDIGYGTPSLVATLTITGDNNLIENTQLIRAQFVNSLIYTINGYNNTFTSNAGWFTIPISGYPNIFNNNINLVTNEFGTTSGFSSGGWINVPGGILGNILAEYSINRPYVISVSCSGTSVIAYLNTLNATAIQVYFAGVGTQTINWQVEWQP